MANGIRKNPDGSIQYNVNGKWTSQKPNGPTQTTGNHKPGGNAAPTPTVSSTTPFGSSSTTVDKDGNVIGKQTLAPGQQGALGGLEGASSAASGNLNGLVSSPGFGQSWSQNPSGTQTYEDAFFNHLTGSNSANGVEATYKRKKDELTQKLANQGIPMGSTLYNDQMAQLDDDHSKQVNDAHDQATTSGVTAYNQGQVAQNQSAQTLSNVGTAGFFNPQGINPEQTYATSQGTALGHAQIAGQQAVANIGANASMTNARIAAATSAANSKRANAAPLPTTPFG